MNKELEQEIDSMITRRILMYHRNLVKTGAIKDIPNECPSAIPQSSRCNRLGHRPTDDHQEGRPLRQGDPVS